MKAYHYTESGLDNVYISGVSIEVDDAGEKVITIPAINELHRVIALGIVSHKHGISGAELRFLRTEMGLSQAELAKFIHRDGQSVGRWERGEVEIDETAETVIRLLANELLELNAGTTVAETARRAGATVIRNPIKIAANKGSGEPYRLIAA